MVDRSEETALRQVVRIAYRLAAVTAVWLAGQAAPAAARDLGQWEAQDPEIRQWYQALMQPDHPTVSCCGEADAYWCDEYGAAATTVGGEVHAYCEITDDRPDEPRGRPHVPVGTLIEIPSEKLKWDSGNPTGHGVVFLSGGGHVWCYVQPGGA